MSEHGSNGGTPPRKDEDSDSHVKTDEPHMPQSVVDVLKRNKGHDIAMKVLGASHDYSKSKILELKTTVIERDSDLITISKQFLDQERRIKSLKLQVQGKNRELAKLKQEAKDSSDRAIRYADALIDSVGKVPKPPSDEKPGPSAPSTPSGEPDESEPSNPASPSAEKEEEHASVFHYEVYKSKIRSLNLDELNMSEEADTMTKVEDCSISEDEPLKYPVPPQLMGLLIGRQKVTLKRIVNQSATEIEPISWVEEGQRVIGFEILGSVEAISKAIGLMIRTVRSMDRIRAKRIIMGHIKTADKLEGRREEPHGRDDPARKPNTQGKPHPQGKPGSKSFKICPQFSKKGHCSYGSTCKFVHRKGNK